MERPDVDELKGAIKDELFGEKKYAFQQGKESVLKDIEELEAALDMLDIDYSNMSASELEAVKGKNLKRKTNTVEEYIYFESPVVFKNSDGNSKYYTVELATEKIKDQANDLLDLYNVRLKASPVKNVKSTLNATEGMPSNTIISQPDGGVKSYQNANDPRGVYHKDIIYLFEKANASTFMHETAHWFKEELKKFGSEKSAMMLKRWMNGKRRLYIHKVELKNKLADVFTTSYNTSTPASSKSIISKLIAEVNTSRKYMRMLLS